MAKHNGRWIRLYVKVVDDPKVQRLKGEAFKAWVNLLCVANEKTGELPARGDIAFKLRLADRDLDAVLATLETACLIERHGDVLCIHDWGELQFQSDSSTERSRKWRQRPKDMDEASDEQRRNVACDDPPTSLATSPL